MFGPLKRSLGSCSFHNNEEVEVLVDEWLHKPEFRFYDEAVFYLPRWDKCSNVLGENVEK
jgi:hypothetical protein